MPGGAPAAQSMTLSLPGLRAARATRLLLDRRAASLLLLVMVMTLGVGLRFSNLGGKPYWFDEVVTSLRISGLWQRDLHRELDQHPRVFEAGDFRAYQSPQPGTSWGDVVRGLASEEPQHAPLYYVGARAWAQALGSSPGSIRTFTALMSALGLPCAYWFALELFGSGALALAALALVAVSPLELLQAQTAREYGMWTSTFFLSSAALLRALRLQTRGSWVAYGLSSALALHTFVFSAFFLTAQCAYALWVLRAGGARRLRPFIVAAGLALITILPWLLTLESPEQIEGTTSWSSTSRGTVGLLKAHVAGFSRLFFDLNSQSGSTSRALLLLALLTVVLGAVFALGVATVWRDRRDDRGMLLGLLIAGSALPLIAHDLILQGQLSAAHRFMAPAYAAVHIVFARALVNPRLSLQPRLQRLANGALLATVALGLVSCVAIVRADRWWNKDPNNVNVEVGRVLSASTRPLLVADGWPEDMFSLAYHLDAKLPVVGQFIPYQGAYYAAPPAEPPLPSGHGELFYFNPRPYTPGPFAAWLGSKREAGLAEAVVGDARFTVLWKVR